MKLEDYWSRDKLNFDFLEKGLGTVSLPHFVYDFQQKYVCYIVLPNQISLSDRL